MQLGFLFSRKGDSQIFYEGLQSRWKRIDVHGGIKLIWLGVFVDCLHVLLGSLLQCLLTVVELLLKLLHFTEQGLILGLGVVQLLLKLCLLDGQVLEFRDLTLELRGNVLFRDRFGSCEACDSLLDLGRQRSDLVQVA